VNAGEAAVEKEEAQGKRLATLAREAGVEHYVYTSVGSAHKQTGVPHFDNKWRIEETVRGLRFAIPNDQTSTPQLSQCPNLLPKRLVWHPGISTDRCADAVAANATVQWSTIRAIIRGVRSVAFTLLMCAAFGQAPRAGVDTRPQFEVASIRPFDSNAQRPGIGFSGSRFTGNGVSARLLIEMAYELQPFRLSNAPGWIDSELYTVQATWSEANGTRFREMLQRLLEERFHLEMRRESKEQNLYGLLVRDKNKLQPTKTPGRSATRARAEDRNVRTEFVATTMGRFAEILSRELNRLVVDETGLPGEYDFVLETEREVDEKNMFVTPLVPSVGQAGLKLEARKGPVEFYTIRAIERPSEN